MNDKHEDVEQYLAEVGRYLEPLPDKDQILKELRAHIWDLANRISDKGKDLTIQDCFEQALMMMEEPKVLASKFLEEEPDEKEWRAPLRTPETKMENEQFIILAVVGVGAVIVFSWLMNYFVKEPIVSMFSFLLGLGVTGIFIVMLYVNDERLFKEQIGKLRQTFQRTFASEIRHKYYKQIYDEIRHEVEKDTQPVLERKVVEYYHEEKPVKEVSYLGAFGEHFGGFIGGIFTAFFMALLFYWDISGFPLFNENWYYIGAFALYISLGVDLLYFGSLVLIGKIRVSRILSAGKNFVGAISAVVLVMFFPFTIDLALQAVMPADFFASPDFMWILSNINNIVRVIIGIVGLINLLEGLYDIFKFGTWKPSDRKSLI